MHKNILNKFYSEKPMIMFLFLSCIFIFSSLFVSQQTIVNKAIAQVPNQTPTNLLNYTNPTYGIKMQYPKDWTASTSGIPSYNGIIGFYSPLQDLSDVLPAELTLSITTYSKAISLDEYTKTTLAALEKQGITVDESSPITLAGKPGHKVTFSPPSPAAQKAPLNLKVMQTWTIIDNKVYLLSFSAESSKFSTNLPLAQKILDSLKIQPLPSV
jgi:hypothetical protein